MSGAEPRQRAIPARVRGRRAARLAAVQALYQMELTGDDSESVTQQFVEHRFGKGKGGEPDPNFFGDIVRGVPHRQAEIDRAVQSSLSTEWRLNRIDATLRAILRAGVYELVARRDVPAKVIIGEYVEIAHAFFEEDQPAFVNALLDRVARKKRPREFGEEPSDDELDL